MQYRASELRRNHLPRTRVNKGKKNSRKFSIYVGSVMARKRSIIALTCSGTSSWQKCPEPTVLPCRTCGNISRGRGHLLRNALLALLVVCGDEQDVGDIAAHRLPVVCAT